ncbi:MAG: hypothetical protein JWO36_2247 [Myxococcales bacterium]|nr:hypothetical protein [Myxococcales bacterium]
MSTALKLTPTETAPLSWARICELHPNEWVCLRDVETAPDGSIRSARVIGHDESMRQALVQIDLRQPSAVVVHTYGRPLHSPRIEMTDEIRDIVRPRR